LQRWKSNISSLERFSKQAPWAQVFSFASIEKKALKKELAVQNFVISFISPEA